MAEYIEREEAIKNIKEHQCRNCSDIGLCGNCAVLTAIKLFENIPAVDVQPVKWIPFSVRDLDEEEKAEHPEWDWILDGKLPEDGQRILVNVKFKGHESVQMDEYYEDDGCYLDSGYEIGTEVTHWMPLPKPPKDGET